MNTYTKYRLNKTKRLAIKKRNVCINNEKMVFSDN